MINVFKIFIGFVIMLLAFSYLIINLYANPLGYATPTAGAIGFLAFSILLSSLIYSLKTFTKLIKILLVIQGVVFFIGGFLFSLICLYSLSESMSYPMASSLLLLGSVLPLSTLIMQGNRKNEFSQS
jgi:hypothetical protein